MALVTALARKYDRVAQSLPKGQAIAAVYFALMVQMPGAEQEYTG